MLPLMITAVYINIRNKNFNLPGQDLLIYLGSIVGITGLSSILTRSNFVYASTDSFNHIFHGKVLAASGLVPWAISSFSKLGSFSSILQMTSHLLQVEYLSGYQTLLALILVVVLLITIWDQFNQYFSVIISLLISGALILILGSDTFLTHTFYIHNNLPAAVMLFLSLYCFWNYYQNDNREWRLLGTILIIGFSFTRIEGPLYSVLILLLVMGIKPLSYRQTLQIVLPYTITALLWHTYLFLSTAQNQLLSQTNMLVIISALVGLTILALISKWMPTIINLIPEAMVSLLFFTLILAILIEPDHMLTSNTHVWQNLTNIYFWSWTWFITAAFLPVLLNDLRKHPENRLLIYSTASYILVVLLLVLARRPYRIGQTDSANRLMLQILPVILFTFASKAGTIKKWFFPNPPA
jgi:hypothetical protein